MSNELYGKNKLIWYETNFSTLGLFGPQYRKKIGTQDRKFVFVRESGIS